MNDRHGKEIMMESMDRKRSRNTRNLSNQRVNVNIGAHESVPGVLGGQRRFRTAISNSGVVYCFVARRSLAGNFSGYFAQGSVLCLFLL